MIKIENISKKFEKNLVLNNINLNINKEGIFAILGPNGSGKTTLIKSILGMVIPNEGDIYVLGENIKDNYKYRSKIDYLPQIANFPNNLKVSELIKMIKDIRGVDNTEYIKLMKIFNIEPFLDKKLGILSGGTKQKVNLILTFMFNSPLIILDEPTTGLDPISVLKLKELLKSEKLKGKTILITSHIINFIEEISDQIIFLLEGEIYFRGSVNDLKESTGQNNLEQAIASIQIKDNDKNFKI